MLDGLYFIWTQAPYCQKERMPLEFYFIFGLQSYKQQGQLQDWVWRYLTTSLLQKRMPLILLLYLLINTTANRYNHLRYIYLMHYQTLLLLTLFGFVHMQAIQDPPKLPLYVGLGYNLLLGNPLSNQVDPGFQHSIFDFTYNKKVTTEDGKYLIPDGVSHRKASSCTFTTEVQTFRGTQTYAQELKTKATVSGGYNGAIVQAAFSVSHTYQAVSKSTLQSNESITHATAECEAYQLSIDIFTFNTFLANFVQGAIESHKAKNWDKFITQFGTHFIYEVVMGGRATQEITYDFQSVSKLQSINIDLSISAKASYAKFFLDSSFDWHKHTEEISYSEKQSKTISELYIGGQPVRDGNPHDWAVHVIENPMPIRYKVFELSELFSKIKDASFNQTDAVLQFHKALDSYCATLNCKKPIPDKPKPPPATFVEARSKLHGGGGGSPFEFMFSSTTMNAVKFNVRHGTAIDNIQIELGDGVVNKYTPAFGGGGGSLTEWAVPTGQHISQIEYRSGDRVDALTFVTNTGVKSPIFGGGGGSYSLQTFPDGYRIIGIYGRSGSRLDQLGFILAKTIYPSHGEPQTQIIRKQLISQ